MDEMVAEKWKMIWWSCHIGFLWLSLITELNEIWLDIDNTSRRASEHSLVAVRKAGKELREFCPLVNKMARGD